MKLAKKWNLFPIIILICLLVLPGMMHSLRYLSIFNLLFLNIVLALGVYSLWTIGYINAAQPAFFGLGAYTIAILTIKVHWPFWLAFPLAGIIPAIIGIMFGWVFLKMKGAYFLFVTIALCELIIWLFKAWKGLFGGIDGLYPIPQPQIQILGLKISFSTSSVPYYYLALLLAVITCLFYFKIARSRLGRVWESVSKNENLLGNTGISVFSEKLACLAATCFFAGLAGAVYAPYMNIASPGEVSLWQGIWIVLGVLVGGIFSPVGAIIGTIFMAVLNVLLEKSMQFQPLILGVTLILVLQFMPNGLFGLSDIIKRKMRLGVSNKVAAGENTKTD